MPRLIIFVISIALITAMAPEVFAQSALPLMVSPARQEIVINPDETAYFSVRFYNLSKSPISGFIKVSDFIVDNNEGTPKIIESPNQAFTRFSAQNWVTLPYTNITIAAQDEVSLQAKVKVPINARPGGHYISLYFESTPPSEGVKNKTNTDIVLKLSSLIYLKVDGKIFEKATINRFIASNFYEYGPVKVEVQILNRGDYHIKPKGATSLTDIFGKSIDQSNLKEENVFPDATKNYKSVLGLNRFMIGRYKISFFASYGQTGQIIETSRYIWIFPWRLTLIIILLMIFIILIRRKYYRMKL